MGHSPDRDARTESQAAHLLRAYPDWVPAPARTYLVHTEEGLPIRALARQLDVHASTILRQVRRIETRRDDPLIDAALRQLSRGKRQPDGQPGTGEIVTMPKPLKTDRASPPVASDALTEARIAADAIKVLRGLCDRGAVLAVARDMEKAVVVRDDGRGQSERMAVVDRVIAEAMALKEWITCPEPGARIGRYQITAAGRVALKQLMASAENRAMGFAEMQTPFAHGGLDEDDLRELRPVIPESPLAGLARRRDKEGEPFLSRDLVIAGERLREDFELSQVGPRVATDWDSYLTGPGPRPTGPRPGFGSGGAAAARERVAAALADLGPGLGDVALRCCCYLEGLEQTERRMGWSARSGKIVLRIALQRLQRHYLETQGRYGPKIG